MKAAQELYEGVEIEGMGAVGLITYMRTDSLRISDEARDAAASCIENIFGKDYLPSSPRVFKSKKKRSGRARGYPAVSSGSYPDRVKASLTTDQFKIYKLVWERFIASQMANALLDTVSVSIEAEGCIFKASGYSVKFDGFTRLYEEKKGRGRGKQ